MAETSSGRVLAPKGSMTTVEIGGRAVEAYRALHHSGSGPGLMLLADEGGLDEGMRARADLFGEEGYSVLAFASDMPIADVAAAADILRGLPETAPENGGDVAAVGHGPGGVLACRAAADAGFRAVVVFDAPSLANDSDFPGGVPCPVVVQFGTLDNPAAEAAAAAIRSRVGGRKDGSRVYDWPDGAPGFAVPHRPAFDKLSDSLAHTRTLEVVRRVLGPYYDYEALFAEHVRHEFETLDVDAVMATMIDEPYVNHAATLAGGVGHDHLKRFYKYHFVDQNAGVRKRIKISCTVGPDRLVVENYTKFVHDTVLDRYFPGIEPTGKKVELVILLLVKFRGDKVCHEHIYWDQASALKQIGVLDAGNLPIAGPEAARKIHDETLPSNIFMQEVWATSEGKPI